MLFYIFRMATGRFSLAIICLLLVAIVNASTENDNEANRSKRHQYYTAVRHPHRVQYHQRQNSHSKSSSSRRPSNYFEAYKQPKHINYHRDFAEPPPKYYHPEPPAYRYQNEPVKTAITSYFPVDLDEPKPFFPLPIKPSAPITSYYPEPEHHEPSYYPEVEEPEYYEPTPAPPLPEIQPYTDYCPKMNRLESRCRPASQCSVWYDLVLSNLPESACILPDGGPGACCPDIPKNGINKTENFQSFFCKPN